MVVDLVASDAVVGWCRGRDGGGFDLRAEDAERGLSAQGAVGPALVVVLAEGVELELEVSQ